MSIIHYCDLLKSPIFFLYKGEGNISTKIGFLFSVLLLVLLVNSAAHSDFFRKAKPAISLQADFQESYGEVFFDRSNFSIVAKIADFTGTTVYDYSYFYFNMTFNTMNLTSGTILHNKKFMKICQEADIPPEGKSLNLSGKSYCPRQTETMILKGSPSSPTAQYAIIQLNRCDKYSASFFNVTCKTKQEMDDYMLNKFLYIYYTDNTFDLTNLETPIHRSFITHLVYFYPNIKKTTTISLQKTMIYTDLGQNFLEFSSAETVQQSYRIGEVSSDFSSDAVHFHEVFFASDRITQKMSRSYLKFQDLLAVLGGVSSSYLMITGFLISNYKKFLLLFEVFGHLFIFPEFKQTKKAKRTTKTSFSKTKNPKKMEQSLPIKNEALTPKESQMESPVPRLFTRNSESCVPNTDEGQLNKIEIKPFDININFPDKPIMVMESKSIIMEKQPKLIDSRVSSISTKKKYEIDIVKSKKSSISLTDFENFQENQPKTPKITPNVKYWEYLKFRIKKLLHLKFTQKEFYMREAEKRFKAEMDILKILEKLKEIEKLKSIIFDPVQRNLFDIFAKQKIDLNLKNEKETKNKHSDIRRNMIRELTKKRGTATEFDQRLVNSLRSKAKF